LLASHPLTPPLSPWEREQTESAGSSVSITTEDADSNQPSPQGERLSFAVKAHDPGEGGASAPGEGDWPQNETNDDEEDDLAADLPDPDANKSSWGIPDLVLIDGGQGQLAAAHEVLAELGISDINLAGIAKGPDRNAGREHFFQRGRPSFMLEPRDPVLYFVQRLRDEAHRFAIGTHRAKRSKAIAANPLDEIPGVGAKRRSALLKHFGSAKAISRAGVEDLQAVEGISAAMAQTIYDFFRQ
jgi:excinuclease ABC subunit C